MDFVVESVFKGSQSFPKFDILKLTKIVRLRSKLTFSLNQNEEIRRLKGNRRATMSALLCVFVFKYNSCHSYDSFIVIIGKNCVNFSAKTLELKTGPSSKAHIQNC